jgi:hypothetical protein
MKVSELIGHQESDIVPGKFVLCSNVSEASDKVFHNCCKKRKLVVRSQ